MKKNEEAQRLKMHVFDLAMELIHKNGYDNVTVRDICDKAEISTGMFYRKFRSKEYLLNFYYEKFQETFDEEVEKKLEGLEIEDQLVIFYRHFFSFASQCGVDFCRNFFVSKNEIMNTEVFRNKIIAITDRYLQIAVSKGFVISGGRAPYQVSRDLCCIGKGVLFDWCAHIGNYDIADYGEQLYRRVIKSIL